jgi:hypothetical protein
MAENLSLGNLENVSLLEGLYNQTLEDYEEALQDYEDNKDQIDNYVFFSEIREEEPS